MEKHSMPSWFHENKFLGFRPGLLTWGSKHSHSSFGLLEQGDYEIAWTKVASLFSLISNWKVAFPFTMNVDKTS